MAGDWIPMRVDLARDPAVIALSSAHSVDEDVIVGKLHRLWSWASEQIASDESGDGHAVGVTLSWIDRYCDFPGFGKSLIDVGWLAEIDGGISLPQFARWMGQSGKTRILAAKRQKKRRHALRVTPPLPEERREEKSKEEEEEGDNNSSGIVFATREGSWCLSDAKQLEFRQTYTGVDVEAELRLARQWLNDHPTQQKTARGMTRFLSSWLKKEFRDKRQQQQNGATPRITAADLLGQSRSEHPELWGDA